MNEHIIKNFDELAGTPLKKDALDILEAGYSAISTEKVINSQIKIENNILLVKDKKINLDDYERIFFIGIGKCAADSGKAFEGLLGDKITDGMVLDVRGVKLKKIKSLVGTHPFPSDTNIKETQSIEKILESATKRDLVIAVVSGGGSALLCLPNDLKCDMLVDVTKTLMKKGASIKELNIARKHLSLIEGGQFAKIAYPAKILSFIFSDVPGDDISTIASGPTVMDSTTREDAEKIFLKYDILDSCKLPDCEIIETPKEEKYFEKVDNILMLTNKTALFAMKDKAKELGYVANVVDTKIQGEARSVGGEIAKNAKNGECSLYGGETTVTVTGDGTGGRSQELVLGALPYLKDDEVLVAAASDGWDNSLFAGAIGSKKLFEKSKESGLDIDNFLENNNSYEFFKKTKSGLDVGRVGSNVSDLYFVLMKK